MYQDLLRSRAGEQLLLQGQNPLRGHLAVGNTTNWCEHPDGPVKSGGARRRQIDEQTFHQSENNEHGHRLIKHRQSIYSTSLGTTKDAQT